MRFSTLIAKNKDWWQQAGQQLGYPQCCIDSFSVLAHMNKPERKLTGTGYVPCAECNQKTETELVTVIQENRDPSLPPFPHAEAPPK